MFKSATQPYCRCCGTPIKKYTDSRWCHEPDSDPQFHSSQHGRDVVGTFRNKADCQRVSNLPVVSVSYNHDRTKITRFTVWDGESYWAEFFCSGTCSHAFAVMAARSNPDLVTKAYNAARRAK